MSEESSPEIAQGTTLLYCSPRQALGAEDIKTIRNALEEEGYQLTPSEDGNNLMIQRAADAEELDMRELLG